MAAKHTHTGWIYGQTLPPPSVIRMAAELKARSMQQYGRPAEEVEAEYLKILYSDDTNAVDLDDTYIRRRKL